MERLFKMHLTFVSKTKTRQFILTIIIIISPLSTVGQGLDTCNISILEPLSKALLTCQFLEDTARTKNITVYRWVEHNQTKVLLECYSRNNRPFCDKEDGVRYTGNFIQNVTVEIPSKTLEESRLYWCSSGYSKADKSATCIFGGSRSADTERQTADPILRSSNYSGNNNILEDDVTSKDGLVWKLVWVLVASNAFTLAPMLWCFFFWACRKKASHPRDAAQSSNLEHREILSTMNRKNYSLIANNQTEV